MNEENLTHRALTGQKKREKRYDNSRNAEDFSDDDQRDVSGFQDSNQRPSNRRNRQMQYQQESSMMDDEADNDAGMTERAAASSRKPMRGAYNTQSNSNNRYQRR